MSTNRTRPFILRPVVDGAPTWWAQKHFQDRLSKFRRENPEFHDFLVEIEKTIVDRKLDYCDNIILFIKGEAKTNWISTGKSIFSMFILLFNYDFSSEQSVDYIEKCRKTYVYLLNDKLEISNEYKTYTKESSWDGSTRDFLNISFSPTKKPENLDDYYYLNIDFCSLQRPKGERMDPYSSDTKIKLCSQRDIYEDSLMLFDYFQGAAYLNSVLKFAIKEMLRKKIISGPIDMDYGYSILPVYKIEKPHSYRIK